MNLTLGRTELKNAEEHLTAPLRNTEEGNKKKVVLPAKHVTTMTERKVQKTLEDAERNLLQQKLALYKELTENKKKKKHCESSLETQTHVKLH